MYLEQPPVFRVGEEVCLWDESAPEGFRKSVIEGCEWYGSDRDDWEHVPSWYYNVEGDDAVWPEINIRKGSSLATAAYILDRYLERCGVDATPPELPAINSLIWEIAAAIEGQIGLQKSKITDRYKKYFATR